MIAGHLGIAFGVRAANKGVSLPVLLAATVAPDAVDVALAAARICNPDGALSHSLPAVVLLALAVTGAARWYTRDTRTALLAGALVLVHVPCDYITGHKAFLPGWPLVGLYVYRWPALDLAIELPILIAGWWALSRTGEAPRWAVSRTALVALFALQLTGDTSAYFSALHEHPRQCRDVIPWRGPPVSARAPAAQRAPR